MIDKYCLHFILLVNKYEKKKDGRLILSIAHAVVAFIRNRFIIGVYAQLTFDKVYPPSFFFHFLPSENSARFPAPYFTPGFYECIMNTPALLLMLFVSLFCLFYLFLWPDARSQLPRRFQLYLLMFVVFAGVFFFSFSFCCVPKFRQWNS